MTSNAVPCCKNCTKTIEKWPQITKIPIDKLLTLWPLVKGWEMSNVEKNIMVKVTLKYLKTCFAKQLFVNWCFFLHKYTNKMEKSWNFILNFLTKLTFLTHHWRSLWESRKPSWLEAQNFCHSRIEDRHLCFKSCISHTHILKKYHVI